MKRALLSLGLCLTFLAATSCRSGGVENKPAADDNGNIKIGVCADSSPAGQATKNGAQLAADEINKAGGVGSRQVELVFDESADAIAHLAGQTRAIVCGASTNAAAAAKAQAAKVPLVTTASNDPKLTAAGDYVFRVSLLDSFQGEAMAKYAANNIHAKTAAIISESGSAHSEDLARAFEENFTKLGGQVTQKLTYAQSDQDFKSQLTPLHDSAPEVIYIPGGYAQVGKIAKQARELGIKATLLGGDTWNDPKLFEAGADALDGSYITGLFSANDPETAVRKFNTDYQARFGGGQPDTSTALAYDATNLVADAIKRAGATDPAKLRDALAQTSKYKGLTGELSFNPERNAVKPTQILKIQGGKFYPVFRGEL